jgi:NADH dehydrogenase
MTERKRIIIIGAGFAGLDAANALNGQDVDVLVIDRHNYHTFTPLLYQVATCGLDPSAIAYPVRTIFRRHRNVHFLMGNVEGIDTAGRNVTVRTEDATRTEHYDWLLLAAGSVTNFFRPEVERNAFGLKDLEDAIVVRQHILKLFEKATWAQDAAQRQAFTTFVVVGGGPTGIETAGALYELYNYLLAQEYGSDQPPLKARVILLEATDRLLAPYPTALQQAAVKQLASLGVEVMLNAVVERAEPDRVVLKDGRTIPTYTLVWAAGVKAAPLVEMLGVPLQRNHRVPVRPDLRVEGLERVYAAGDLAYLLDEKGEPYPMVIQVAKQQGRRAARNILKEMRGEAPETFVYRDLGIMATIGRRRAVAWIFNRVQMAGLLAWFAWLFLHLVTLMGFRNRASVFINWVWNYLTYDRSVRIILNDRRSRAAITPPTAPVNEPTA